MGALDRLERALKEHESYESHKILTSWDCYEGWNVLTLVRVTFHDRASWTGVGACTCFEVWEQDASGMWDCIDPEAESDTDLRGYDESYNPTPIELLAEVAESFTNNEQE
jgi:hypothetical protein